jgi:CRISPR-associated protein Cas2
MLKQKYFLTGIFILSAERQPIKLSWRKIVWLLNYGHRVQNSVFECVLSEAQFLIFKSKIIKIIDCNLDSVRFYFLSKNWNRRIECLGRETAIDVNSELII